MSSPPWRKITSVQPGTAAMYSAKDLNDIMDLLNGLDTGKPVRIGNTWTWLTNPSGISITDKTKLPSDALYDANSRTVTGKTMDYNANTFLNFPFNPAGAGTGSPTSPNTYSALQTFRDMDFALRNPLNTYTLTFKNPSITTNQTFQFNAPFDYYVFIDPDDGYYKAKNCRTGGILSTDTTGHADTVINAAIVDIGSAGGNIFLGRGTFDIYNPVPYNTYTQPVSIIGSGRGITTIRRQISGWNVSSMCLNADNQVLAHLTVDGNYPSNTSLNGAEVAFTGKNFVCHDVEIKRSYGQNDIGTGSIGVIDSCVLTGLWLDYTPPAYTSNRGVMTYATGLTPGWFNVIRNCNIQGHYQAAIRCYGNAIVDGNFLSYNNIVGGGQIANLDYSNPGTMIIVNNYITRSVDLTKPLQGDSGIEVGNAVPHVIANNIIYKASGWGIAIEPLSGAPNSGVVVDSNWVIGCGYQGIGTTSGSSAQYTRFSITNNHVYDNANWGIYVGPYAFDYYLIANNMCAGNVIGQLQDNGTGTNKRVYNNLGYVNVNGGLATFSGTGALSSFTIAHGLSAAPAVVSAAANTDDARGNFKVTADATNITVAYTTAPPSGSSNVKIYWTARTTPY